MTQTDAAADRSSLVPGVHRLVRAVDGKEGPFAGALIAHEDGVAVSVPVAELAGWNGWAYSGSEHVCGVIDVRRRVDGHDALLPWCTQRVEVFLGRRRAAEELLAPGEVGTLVASLLRGVRELGDEASETVGEWWLTGEGRPVFVHGGGGSVRAGTAALIDRIAPHTVDRATVRILDEVAAALRDRRHHPEDDARWEAQLFALAAPRALRTDVFAPEKVVDLVPRRSLRAGAVDGAEPRRLRARTIRERRDRWAPVRAGLAEVRGRSHELVARLRRRTDPEASRGEPRDREAVHRSRRRPLILAASLAAIVLVVGMMWPDGQEAEQADAATLVSDTAGGRAAEGPRAAEPTEASEAPEPPTAEMPETPADPAPEQSASGDADDALAALPALLKMIEVCAAEQAETCPALSEGVALPVEGLVVGGPSASEATLVDDYGDVAVVKLIAGQEQRDAAAQMLVLERREQKWLVRDVYDVAHQPD